MKTASLTFDLKDCLRGLRRDWGYAATVVLTLALTIGGTTAVFSIVEGVLYRPLAYAESQRLVVVREVVNRLSNVYPSVPVNAHHFAMWRDQAQSFESLAELVSSSMNLTGHGEPMEVHVIQSSGALFDVLRAQAAAGRLLKTVMRAIRNIRTSAADRTSWSSARRSGEIDSVVTRRLSVKRLRSTDCSMSLLASSRKMFDCPSRATQLLGGSR
jgi:hypothetical protein